MEIINFTEQKAARDGDLFFKDHRGEIWFPFSFKYKLEGREFSFEAWARSEDEAKSALFDALKSCEFGYQILQQGEVTPEMVESAIAGHTVTWTEE